MNTRLQANEALQRIQSVLDSKYEGRRYRTSNATVQAGGITRDEFRRPVKVRVTIDGISDYVLPAFGFDVNEGDNVEVENVGTIAAPDYRFVGSAPGISSSLPSIIGSFSGGIDLMNLPGIRVRADGFIILGGDLNEAPDGTLTPAGGRIEERKYGIEGYSITEDLMFGLYAQARAYRLNSTTTINFNPGDFHVGLLGKAHLRVDTALGKLQWLSGTTVLFESYMVDGNPFNHMAGLLRVAATHVGEGIEIGKLPGGPYVIQMLNKEGVPMFLVRVGFDADPGHYYLRIGPPSPSPHIEMTEDASGNPLLNIPGGLINVGSILADRISVTELSAIVANLGTVTAGEIRMGEGVVGTSFTGLRMYKNGTTYRFEGVNNSVPQAYFDSDGKLYGGAGDVWIDNSGINLNHGDTVNNQIKWYYGNTVIGSIYTQGGVVAGFGEHSAMRFEAQATSAGKVGYQSFEATDYDTSLTGTLINYPDALVWSSLNGRIGLNVRDNGSAAIIGFLEATPVIRQVVTGSRGANAALASLLTALANFGLITDSTS